MEQKLCWEEKDQFGQIVPADCCWLFVIVWPLISHDLYPRAGCLKVVHTSQQTLNEAENICVNYPGTQD